MRIKDIIPGNLVAYKPSYSRQQRLGVIVEAPSSVSLGKRELAVAWLENPCVIYERIEHLDVVGKADKGQLAIATRLQAEAQLTALMRQRNRAVREALREQRKRGLDCVQKLQALSALTF